MEHDQDFEISRLKKLLEEKIMQVEKENMAILQGSTKFLNKTHEDLACSVKRNLKSCPHVKASPPIKEQSLGSDVSPTDIHSRIHFLKDMESSFLHSFDKKKFVIDGAKNRYIPCAIPLSPPIRLKRDICDERMHSASYVENPVSEQFLPKVIPNKSPKEDFTKIEKGSPSRTICDRKQSTPERKKIIEGSPSRTICDRKQSTPERKKVTEVKNAYKKLSFVQKDKIHPSFRSSSGFLSNEKMPLSSVEEEIPKTKSVDSSSQVNEEKYGLHLQISLDSCSTKDVVSKMLCKIPNFLNEVEASSNGVNTSSSNCNEQMEKNNKFSQTSDIESFNNIAKYNRNPEKQIQIASSFVQTDELPIDRRDLQYLVKEIVLETLQNMQISGKEKATSTCLKVDSGIQSEVENDIADFRRDLKMEFPGKGTLLNQGNSVLVRQNSSISKGVQVDLFSIQIKKQNVHDKSSNTENPDYLLDMLQDNVLPASVKQPENATSDSVSERNSSPVQEPNRIELMLEKIYGHLCQEKEVTKTINDIPLDNPILTRDVAVQFNPLQTSTKSTLTSEIKQADSSCQYDIEFKVDPVQKLSADASVQATHSITKPSDNHHLQINAYTQYEHKTFIDSTAQTELLLNSEHSATNTSVCSTPVSDSMFMDDLISEGEISLPWNLRLLSLSGGSISMNNADSSDTSTKDKDYSLSEGEIHPNVLHYLNMHQSNHSDETGQNLYPARLETDSQIQYASSSDTGKPIKQCNTYGKNPQLYISTSSLSEGEINSNASLSLGEVSPGFRVSFSESLKSQNHPSNKSFYSSDKSHCAEVSAVSSSKTNDMSNNSLNLNFSNSGQHGSNADEETDLQNPRNVLHTVDEEVHSIFD